MPGGAPMGGGSAGMEKFQPASTLCSLTEKMPRIKRGSCAQRKGVVVKKAVSLPPATAPATPSSARHGNAPVYKAPFPEPMCHGLLALSAIFGLVIVVHIIAVRNDFRMIAELIVNPLGYDVGRSLRIELSLPQQWLTIALDCARNHLECHRLLSS